MKIVQNTEYFNFSLDSVLLANFITIRSKVKNIIDLGTGNAPIPLLLSTRTNANIIGVEIQEPIYQLAIKSVEINNLKNQIKILNEDVRTIDKHFDSDSFDIVLSNPPYFKYNKDSLVNNNYCKTVARHEVMLNIDDILKVSKKLLKNQGYFGIVHRPDRMIEILNKMKEYNIEPKRIRFIYPNKDETCNIILIEGIKNGKEGIKIESPLFVHDRKGNYTREVRKMFGE
ncbi:MAG TPA: tRNA1(Val) (adenine(37)-N6)-methyltransferase [Mollicutes bacterium]|nr:tRNA1(Val) (adenine(37)-N6)-methyltransferase [Mollicutes bacterium]